MLSPWYFAYHLTLDRGTAARTLRLGSSFHPPVYQKRPGPRLWLVNVVARACSTAPVKTHSVFIQSNITCLPSEITRSKMYNINAQHPGFRIERLYGYSRSLSCCRCWEQQGRPILTVQLIVFVALALANRSCQLQWPGPSSQSACNPSGLHFFDLLTTGDTTNKTLLLHPFFISFAAVLRFET